MSIPFVKGLTFRYLAVLIGLASLALAGNFFVKQSIETQKTDAAEINVAGRQRMLSQRAMLLGLELDRLEEGREREWVRQEFIAVIDTMEKSHRALVTGNKQWGFSPPSETIKKMYFGDKPNINARVEGFLKKAKGLLALHAHGAKARSENYNHQFAFNSFREAGFLKLLDDIVTQYQRESEQKIVSLIRMQNGFLFATLCLLFLSALAVFAPAIRRLNVYLNELERIQESLKESNERFRDFTDTASDWVWEMDENLCFSSISDRFFANFAIERRSIIGHTRWERLGPAVIEKDVANWVKHQQDLELRKPFEGFQYAIKDKDGNNHHINISGKPVFNAENNFIGYRGTGKDVTDTINTEIRLRVSEQSLVEAQRLSKIGSWNWDIMTGEVTWSDELFHLLGLNRENTDLSMQTIYELISTDDKIILKQHFRNILANPGYSEGLEMEITPVNGSPRISHLLMKSEFDENGKAVNVMGSIQDITEQKRVLKELLAAKETAETANKVKTEFLSSMSHELRTPLNAILGFGQMLQMDKDKKLDGEQATCVEQIIEGGRLLKDLIDDILDLSKIEAGTIRLTLDNISVDSLIPDCLSMIGGMAKRKNVAIKIIGEADLMVIGDYTRLRQVIINLLSNAVKYNSDDGTIWVKWRKHNESRVRILIEDTGQGVALENQDKLFEPFNRLGAEKSEVEGTGIGLTITKRLIEAMHGEVDFESVEGEGSSFWIDIPLSLPKEQQAVISEIQELVSDSSMVDVKGKILYVEDNPANLKLMNMMIGRMDGIKLICAGNAELGIALAKQNQPDLVLMDINLPGMDGVEALKVLQGMDETKRIPVVAVSAAVMEKDIERGLEAGFCSYLPKPINVKQVMEVLHDVMGKDKP